MILKRIAIMNMKQLPITKKPPFNKIFCFSKYYILILVIGMTFHGKAYGQANLHELNYDFNQAGIEDKDFDKVRLFFRYGNPQPVIMVKISPDSRTLATLDEG